LLTAAIASFCGRLKIQSEGSIFPGMQIKGKTVVVTGGANGIGRALSLRFAKEGAKFIAVSDVDEANGKAVADEIEKDRAGFFPCDVSQEAQVNNLVESVNRAAGQVDIFCSNAGIAVAGGPVHAEHRVLPDQLGQDGPAAIAARRVHGDGLLDWVGLGRQGLEARIVDILKTFPDWHMEILEIADAGDVVVVRCKVSGTHLGVGTMSMNNMPPGSQPTGKRFEVTHMHWHKLRDGVIVEHYANRDDLGMLRQLGLVPPDTQK